MLLCTIILLYYSYFWFAISSKNIDGFFCYFLRLLPISCVSLFHRRLLSRTQFLYWSPLVCFIWACVLCVCTSLFMTGSLYDYVVSGIISIHTGLLFLIHLCYLLLSVTLPYRFFFTQHWFTNQLYNMVRILVFLYTMLSFSIFNSYY